MPDLGILRSQQALSGTVASETTAQRVVKSIDPERLAEITAARAQARAQARDAVTRPQTITPLHRRDLAGRIDAGRPENLDIRGRQRPHAPAVGYRDARSLPSRHENDCARATLEREGLSCLRRRNPLVERVARRLPPTPRLGLDPLAHLTRELPGVGLAVGNPLKSWDVLLSLRAVERNVALTEPVLDLGACSSELPCAAQGWLSRAFRHRPRRARARHA